MKCFVPNYSCLQKTRGLQPPEPRSLCPQLNLLNPPPPEKKFLDTPLNHRYVLRGGGEGGDRYTSLGFTAGFGFVSYMC